MVSKTKTGMTLTTRKSMAKRSRMKLKENPTRLLIKGKILLASVT